MLIEARGGAKAAKELDQVGKSTERVGRQQTRLGQASASAGRQFSAQASGLGGLVAAYAGAAATVFAITAAFQALNAAARAEQTIQGVNALANAIGESGPQIIKGLQEITKGQLSVVQTAELANLALSSGFSADQINNLAEISLKASRALGRDLTDSFNRLVRGVTKLEPELLDELGIFTRIEPAAERYAAQVGKVASQLSNFERRQAFANAVAEEGQEKFSDIDTSADTTSQSLERLSATVADLGQRVGAFVGRVLAPLADAISGNLVASVGAFGILAKTVFGTTIREATGAIENFNNQIESRSVAIIDKLGASSTKLARANDQLSQGLQQVNLRVRAVSSANEQEFKTLVQLGRQNQLTQAQSIRLQQILIQEKASVDKLSLSLSKASMTKAQFAAATQRLENREKQLDLALASVNKRLDATPRFARAAATAFRVVAGSISTVTSKALGLFNAFTTLVTVVSIFTTVGAVILDAFGFLDPIVESVKALIRELRVLFDITKDASAQRDAGAALIESLIPDPDATVLETGLGVLGDKISGERFGEAIIEAIRRGATGSQEEFNKAIGGLLNINAGDLERNAEPLRKAFSQIKFFDAGTLQGVSDFATATGRTLKTVVSQVDIQADGALKFRTEQELGLGIITETAAKFKDLAGLSREQRLEAQKFNDVQTDRLQSQELSVNLAEALQSGQATAEQIEKRRGAILAKIANLEKERVDLQGDALEANVLLATDLRNQLEFTNKQVEAQLAILDARDKIRKTFQADIATAGKLDDSFIVQKNALTETFTISRRQSDETASRNQQLEEALSIGYELLTQQREGVELVGTEAQLAALARDAQTAYVGQFVKSLEAADKLANTLEKIVRSQEKATQAAEAQLEVLQFQRDLAELRVGDADTTRELSQAKALLDIQKQRLDLEKKQSDASIASRKQQIDFEQGLGLISDGEARNLTLKLEQESLQVLREFTDKQIDLLKKRELAEQLAIKAQTASQQAQLETIKQRDMAEKIRLGERLALERDAELRSIDQLEAEAGLIQTQIEGFSNHISGIAEVLAADIVQRKLLQDSVEEGKFAREAGQRALLTNLGGGAGAEALQNAFGGETQLIEAIQRGFTEAEARRAELAITRTDLAPQVESQITELTDRLDNMGFEAARAAIDTTTLAKAELELAKINARTADEKIKIQDKIDALDAQSGLLKEKLALQTDQLNAEYDKAAAGAASLANQTNVLNSTQLKVFRSFKDGINGTLEPAIQGLFQSIADGTFTVKNLNDTLNDFFRSLIENIRKKLLQETLINPLSEGVTNVVKGSVFSEGSGGQSGGILSSIAGFFGGGKASGGLVHMAGGGQVRDRVPAMLEPGEFVIRKPMAKAIGGPVLNSMNATGTMPTGEVAVNITNTGTPQEATASPPRFDGEKMVVDIVMRDLRNNGPIRKSLRAGG